MTTKEVQELHNGDEVFWNDPDEDSECSRYITIQTIEVESEEEGNGIIRISGTDGSCLECFAHELS